MSIISQLARDLLLPESGLRSLMHSAPHRYKVFKIAKSNGRGHRVIAQPAREIKALQYWVIDHLLKKLPVHSAATAYRKGRSIRDNAAKHAPQRFLLKMDFKDFFPSIRAEDLQSYFSVNQVKGLTDEDIRLLQRLLFWKPKGTKKLIMSIGAPSSPILSNALLYDFDKQVQQFCSKRGIKYTRYADDLTFSTNHANLLRDMEYEIGKLCRTLEYPKLKLNKEKTLHASRGGRRTVTGLTLSNEGLASLGRDRKRLIRAQIHRFLSGGMQIDDALKLKGTLAFVNSCEPEFLDRLREYYGSDAIAKILNLGSSKKN